MRLRRALLAAAVPLVIAPGRPGAGIDKLTYHGDAMRSGWNPRETRLTPEILRWSSFGLVWQSPQLDFAEAVPSRLFATPLYVHSLKVRGQTFSAALVVTTAGYVYAIAASAGQGIAPGDILWRRRLTEAPCADGTMGNLATPVINRGQGRLYVTACTGKDWTWQIHALDIVSGEEARGWPVEISPATMDRSGVNRNGCTRYLAGEVYWQRGALNLSPDGSRVYVPFGPDTQG